MLRLNKPKKQEVQIMFEGENGKKRDKKGPENSANKNCFSERVADPKDLK